jgi:hypothetical protein
MKIILLFVRDVKLHGVNAKNATVNPACLCWALKLRYEVTLSALPVARNRSLRGVGLF